MDINSLDIKLEIVGNSLRISLVSYTDTGLTYRICSDDIDLTDLIRQVMESDSDQK
jgi:hypothetical protein